MVERKCSTCDYWESYNIGERGLCRCNAPVTLSMTDPKKACWPSTKADDWCGDWDGDAEAYYLPEDTDTDTDIETADDEVVYATGVIGALSDEGTKLER